MVTVKEVIQLIQDEVLPEQKELHADTKLFSTGFLDSIQLTTLFLSLEKNHNVKIGPFDISQENFDTPEQIARWLNQAIND
jgi:acyl carrier protein